MTAEVMSVLGQSNPPPWGQFSMTINTHGAKKIQISELFFA
ncbi:hypothetical protein SAMN06265370_1228 [Puniceibacterium sediminis]|uniref:Uncharacterized protein n=1 Tax=Puniceibacterium sediminis TaxID=1608407 RepID=A0A238Z0C8_9RHOB|nr:hypothetical protein SAMN06265370_1228 [Puniceibacterium sediminis]